MFHLRKLNRKGNMEVGYAILGIVFAVAMSVMAVLVGGVFFDKTGDVFTDMGINETNQVDWYNLYVNAGDYATTGISIAIVSLIFIGIGVLLWSVLGFFGGKKMAGF